MVVLVPFLIRSGIIQTIVRAEINHPHAGRDQRLCGLRRSRMRQATEDAVAAVCQNGCAKVLQTQIQPAGKRRMDGRNMRPPLLATGEGRDFYLRMAEQNLDQFQGRVARRSQNADAYHDAIPRTELFRRSRRFIPAGALTGSSCRRFASHPSVNIDLQLMLRQGRRSGS